MHKILDGSYYWNKQANNESKQNQQFLQILYSNLNGKENNNTKHASHINGPQQSVT